jgi:hypothetical protein
MKRLFNLMILGLFLIGSMGIVSAVTLSNSDNDYVLVELGQPDDYSLLFLDGEFYSQDSYNIKGDSPLGNHVYPTGNKVSACLGFGGSGWCDVFPGNNEINIIGLSPGNHSLNLRVFNALGSGVHYAGRVTFGGENYEFLRAKECGVLDPIHTLDISCTSANEVFSEGNGEDSAFEYVETVNFCVIGNEECSNEIDDDCDGLLDGDDPDCCVADCNGKQCGNDGCGGTCGSCSSGTCSSGTCVDFGVPLWKDLNGKVIETADNKDSVALEVGGVNASSHAINYTIHRGETPVVWWNPLTWFGEGTTELVAGGIYTFTLDGIYTFTFEVPSLGVSNTSEELTVSNTSDDDPLVLELLSPSCGENFTKGSSVEIKINVSDPDDLIEGELRLNGSKIANLTNGLNNIEYLFDSSGEYSLVARATSRDKILKEISNIMIVDESSNEKYTAACIDSPNNLASFTNHSVRFIAESTRAIDCTETPCQMIIPEGEGSEKIQFNWTFPSEEGMLPFISRGNLTDKNPTNFQANFKSAGFHKAILEVKFI